MARTSNKKRAVVIGVLLGLVVSGRRVVSMVKDARQRGAEDGAQGATPQRMQPGPADLAAGEASGASFGAGAGLAGEEQREAPGVPMGDDADSLLMGGSAASEDAGNLAGASAYAGERTPYGADVSEEGVTLSYVDPTDREEDVPLDEGIPNLGEPEDVADVGPETAAEGATIAEVEAGVPEEYGQETPIDSVEADEPWVAGAPGEEDEMPAASRGLRQYGEGDDDERVIEDTDDAEMLGLYEDVEPSGAGGEVDLESDEAPQGEDEGFSIVDDPDEPLSADAGEPVDPLAPEETLGLRDSESERAPDNEADSGDQSNLGLTGDFHEAAATQRVEAVPGEGDEPAGAEQRETFVTGDRGHEDVDSGGVDRARESHQYGETGEFGVPAPEEAGPSIETPSSDEAVGSTGEPTDVGEEDGAGPDTTKRPEDAEHLGVSGDFDEAADTETVPAVPAEGEESGDEGEAPEASASESGAGYSAAWSTPAGVVGEWPNQVTSEQDTSGDQVGTAEGGKGVGGATPDPSDATAGDSAGESGQITSEAHERAGIETSTPQDPESPARDSEAEGDYPRDPSGGDPEDLASSMAGDLGTQTAPSRGEATTESAGRTVFQDEVPVADQEQGSRGRVNPASGGAEDPATSNAPGAPSSEKPRKSRKQRRLEAMDWVPAGAVKGDGTPSCPAEYPIKGNANSRIYHRPSDPSYAATIPEYCFATEDDAKRAGFRAPRG